MDKSPSDSQPDFKFTPVDNSNNPSQPPVADRAQNEAIAFDDDKTLYNWSAPDSFSVSKSPGWYLVLILITLALSGGVYLSTKDKITTAVLLVSGLLIGIYAGKKPRTVSYEFTRYGFKVNGRYYSLTNYRSFALISHGDGRSAVLIPLKRFMPYMYLYFDSKLEPKVVTTLSETLPIEDSHRDPIDKVLRRIGF